MNSSNIIARSILIWFYTVQYFGYWSVTLCIQGVSEWTPQLWNGITAKQWESENYNKLLDNYNKITIIRNYNKYAIFALWIEEKIIKYWLMGDTTSTQDYKKFIYPSLSWLTHDCHDCFHDSHVVFLEKHVFNYTGL